MATLEELFDKATADEAEREAWAKALSEPGGMETFLAERGCDATPQQAAEFLRARLAPEGELADEELDSVAGGAGGSSSGSNPLGSCSACGSDEFIPLIGHSCMTTCKKCGKDYAYSEKLGWTRCSYCRAPFVP